MQHELILGLIILGAGLLAGTTNYLNHYFVKDSPTQKNEIARYILSSIGASILVPLLLNMLSSDLIKKSDNYNSLNYFVFAGFCFVAGFYSDRFINAVGEKILKDLRKVDAKANIADNKANTALSAAEENKENINLLVSTETEPDDESKIISDIKLDELSSNTNFNDEDLKTQTNKIVNSFGEKYKFRTFTGIAKDLNYPSNIVKIILEGLENAGAAKRFTKSDGKELWTLTNIGRLMVDKK